MRHTDNSTLGLDSILGYVIMMLAQSGEGAGGRV